MTLEAKCTKGTLGLACDIILPERYVSLPNWYVSVTDGKVMKSEAYVSLLLRNVRQAVACVSSPMRDEKGGGYVCKDGRWLCKTDNDVCKINQSVM